MFLYMFTYMFTFAKSVKTGVFSRSLTSRGSLVRVQQRLLK